MNESEGKERKHPPDPPKESTHQSVQQNFKYPTTAREVEGKRAELEMLRIDKEIERLNKPETPDTKLDYFAKMLELQQQHNNQILEMQKQNFNVMLELEKVKLAQSGGVEPDYLTELFKYLPQIMAAKAKEAQKQPETKTEPKQEVKPMKHTQKQLEAYRKKIISGEITQDEAYEDFQKEYPDLAAHVTRDKFNEGFEKIKAGKSLNI